MSDVDSVSPADKDRRVRTPYFPSYAELRRVLPVWDGRQRAEITHLESTLTGLRGTRKQPVDWTEPDVWIPARLEGADRALAAAVWDGTEKQVNPRHVYGHWLAACNYGLLRADESGQVHLTEAGRDFIAHPRGRVEAAIDEGEGLVRLLRLVAEQGPARPSDLAEDWGEYLSRRSTWGSPSSIRDTLARRLANLLQRQLVSRSGGQYAITDSGLDYLGETGDVDAPASGEEQQLLSLAQSQRANVRARVRELLLNMDPIAFEHLVKRLLEAMDYENVSVTRPSNDGGVDVVGDIELGITSVREVIQAKRHRRKIQRKDLDALRGCLHRFDAVRGTIITTSGFSRGTVEAAFERGAAPITLIDGERLIDLLIEHRVGVDKKVIEVLELDAGAFVAAPDGGD